MSDTGDNAPMGANLTDWGATFRIWAPTAKRVSVRGTFNGWTDLFLTQSASGYWYGSVPGVKEGDQYKFFVEGQGTTGYKRDPFARSLSFEPAFPLSNCFVTKPTSFPWHDAHFQPKPFNEMALYQLHVGAYWSADANGKDQRASRPGRFLDLLFRLEYLVDLGINTVQLLPIQEFSTPRSMGYNGIDVYSPEMDYSVPPSNADFQHYFDKANELLKNRGLPPFKEFGTWWSYEIGFPVPGSWAEIFNSDVYENWVNPSVAGNGEQSMSVAPQCTIFRIPRPLLYLPTDS